MGTHPIFESDFDCLTECVLMQLMPSDNSISDESLSGSNSEMISTEFDSDGESKVSSVATEDDPVVYDEEPIGRLPGEVNLSGFHDVCRKILARQIPEGFSSGILCRYKHSSAADRRALERERKKKSRKESKKKKEFENLAREKPQLTSQFDKQLENIAKRGVVDFFNAMEKHQSEMKRKLEEAGPTELRRSKVIKKTKEKDVIQKIDDQQAKRVSKWSVLTNDNAALMEAEMEE